MALDPELRYLRDGLIRREATRQPVDVRTRIDGVAITLDAVTSEEHAFRARVTRVPLESGAQVADDVVNEPGRLRIRGVVTDVLGPTPASALDALLAIRDAKRTVKVDTPAHVYPDMVLTGVRATTSGAALEFDLQFEEVIRAGVAERTGILPAADLVAEYLETLRVERVTAETEAMLALQLQGSWTGTFSRFGVDTTEAFGNVQDTILAEHGISERWAETRPVQVGLGDAFSPDPEDVAVVAISAPGDQRILVGDPLSGHSYDVGIWQGGADGTWHVDISYSKAGIGLLVQGRALTYDALITSPQFDGVFMVSGREGDLHTRDAFSSGRYQLIYFTDIQWNALAERRNY